MNMATKRAESATNESAGLERLLWAESLSRERRTMVQLKNIARQTNSKAREPIAAVSNDCEAKDVGGRGVCMGLRAESTSAMVS
jgi:hypothetical protein